MLELLSAAIKNDPDVAGVTINDSEFLLSQYADDSSLVTDGDKKSLNQCLNLFDKFSECAVLRCNVDKTEAVCIGSKKGSMENFCRAKILFGTILGGFNY